MLFYGSAVRGLYLLALGGSGKLEIIPVKKNCLCSLSVVCKLSSRGFGAISLI